MKEAFTIFFLLWCIPIAVALVDLWLFVMFDFTISRWTPPRVFLGGVHFVITVCLAVVLGEIIDAA